MTQTPLPICPFVPGRVWSLPLVGSPCRRTWPNWTQVPAEAVHRSTAEGALFTSQSWAEEPVLIRTPDPRLLTGKGRRCDLDVCGFSRALCHTARRAAAPMPRGPGPKLGSDSGDRPPFLWDAAGAALLSPGTVLLGSRPPVSSRVRALRARFTESTSRRAVLTAESAPLR